MIKIIKSLVFVYSIELNINKALEKKINIVSLTY